MMKRIITSALPLIFCLTFFAGRFLFAAPAPSSVRVEGPASEKITAKLESGVEVTVPAGATVSSGEGPFAAYVDPESKVILEIRPLFEETAGLAVKIIGFVYEIFLRNEAGEIVRELQQEAELTFPYKDEELRNAGVGEHDIFPALFDENKKEWVRLTNFILDMAGNAIRARTRHFTRFAIVAAADVVPPYAPSRVAMQAFGGGKIEIFWKNPSRDFSHTKIYRSEKRGEKGTVLAAEVSGEHFIDGAIRDGVTYYYLVRAVDPAGNESSNEEHMGIRAVGTSAVVPQETLKEGKAVVPSSAVSSPVEEPPFLPAPPPQERSFFTRLIEAVFGFLKRLLGYGQ